MRTRNGRHSRLHVTHDFRLATPSSLAPRLAQMVKPSTMFPCHGLQRHCNQKSALAGGITKPSKIRQCRQWLVSGTRLLFSEPVVRLCRRWENRGCQAPPALPGNEPFPRIEPDAHPAPGAKEDRRYQVFEFNFNDAAYRNLA
jgi:hypothetical protein